MATEFYKPEDLRTWTPTRLQEVELETRRKLAEMRMDLYQAPQAQAGNVKKLKINLARIMTVKNEQPKKTAKKA